MSIAVNGERAERKLKAIANVLHRPLRDVLDSSARVVATQMARTAQPFGTGADAKVKGDSAVARDILKVYGTPEKAYADIANPKYKALFWKAYKEGQFEVAQAALNQYGDRLVGVPLEDFDGGSAHKTHRGKRSGGGRGMVHLTRPVMIVTNPQELHRYIKEIQKNVGFGKGGFADIARALGKSPRGLREEEDITANWITRHTGFGKAYHGGTEENPTVRIHNAVDYASEILSGSALNEAKRIGRERMLKNLDTAVRAEMKKLKSAA
jgi:hypothetical protein